MLDRESDPDGAAKMIADTWAMREKARALLPTLLDQAQRKAGEEGVKRVIARRFATYPQPERSEEEWAAWWADYVDTLADLPLACLEAAMRAFLGSTGAEFMPKPWKLRELAEITPSRALQRYQRARRALQIADGQTPAIEPPKPDPSQAEAVRALLADFKAKSIAGAKVSPLSARRANPPPPPPTDEFGITPQLRELMARQAAQRNKG